MNTIKKWEDFINENYTQEYYLLFGELVSINNISRWGDEVKVDYTRSDGSKDSYVGDNREFREDFIETSDVFDSSIKKDVVVSKPVIKKEESKYNLVFYIGVKKIETIERNLNSKLAFALKNKYLKDPKYRIGKIIAEKI